MSVHLDEIMSDYAASFRLQLGAALGLAQHPDLDLMARTFAQTCDPSVSPDMELKGWKGMTPRAKSTFQLGGREERLALLAWIDTHMLNGTISRAGQAQRLALKSLYS